MHKSACNKQKNKTCQKSFLNVCARIIFNVHFYNKVNNNNVNNNKLINNNKVNNNKVDNNKVDNNKVSNNKIDISMVSLGINQIHEQVTPTLFIVVGSCRFSAIETIEKSF